MEARLDYAKASPEAFKAMVQMEGVVRRSGIDSKLLELIKIRASQLNGCAYCIDMHTKDARFKGENEQRIYALDAWRETPFFTQQERAALAWAETLTNIQIGHAPDEGEPHPRDYDHQRVESNRHRIPVSSRHLSTECVQLTAGPSRADRIDVGFPSCKKSHRLHIPCGGGIGCGIEPRNV